MIEEKVIRSRGKRCLLILRAQLRSVAFFFFFFAHSSFKFFMEAIPYMDDVMMIN